LSPPTFDSTPSTPGTPFELTPFKPDPPKNPFSVPLTSEALPTTAEVTKIEGISIVETAAPKIVLRQICRIGQNPVRKELRVLDPKLYERRLFTTKEALRVSDRSGVQCIVYDVGSGGGKCKCVEFVEKEEDITNNNVDNKLCFDCNHPYNKHFKQ